jgi:hypothetical protein
MCCFYHTSNTINLVTTTKYAAFGVIEYCVSVKDFVDCGTTTHGVIFAKYVAEITKQQGRYACTSCSPFQGRTQDHTNQIFLPPTRSFFRYAYHGFYKNSRS